MAGNKLMLKTRVKASTMIEVVIATIIIIVVFGIAMLIYANVLKSALSVKKMKAQAILQQALLNAEQSKDNSTQTFTVDDFRIEQEIKSYNNNNQLTDIHLTAYDINQQKVTELEKVIINNE